MESGFFFASSLTSIHKNHTSSFNYIQTLALKLIGNKFLSINFHKETAKQFFFSLSAKMDNLNYAQIMVKKMSYLNLQ